MALNRADWLADMRYAIAQALDLIDDGYADLIPRAEKQWRAEANDQAEVVAITARANQVADMCGNSDSAGDEPLHVARNW